MRNTIKDIYKLTTANKKIVSLSLATAMQAKIADKYCDVILVGDSLGMSIYGMDSTLSVTMQMMIEHGKAVMRATEKAMVIIDMPFASYQQSKEKAYANAAKIISKTGAAAVKIEGGQVMAETVNYLVERSIPVVGHVGMLPQSVNIYGGYKVQDGGRDYEKELLADMLSLQDAGCSMIVIECVSEKIADKILKKIKIPVIAIGASALADGQILVLDDILGMQERVPKFVKKYQQFSSQIDDAVAAYAKDVKAGAFPAAENLYK
jgi:3-methyl-2-oxobutanoate hydroxymethyltransferase